MSLLVTLVQAEAWLFLGAVTLIVLHRLVSGGIDIGEAQLNRAQLLLSVIGIAAYYLATVIAGLGTAKLPSASPTAIAALGGSNLIYLGNKLAQLWPDITQSGKNA
jgi:hypothetical protein